MVCRPKTTKKVGKQLKDRYGEAQEAEALFVHKPVHIEEEEFLNLYAIRSGDINLNMVSGSSWLEKVKSGLFTGGVDPMLLRQRLDTLSSTNKALKHNRVLKELEESMKSLQTELNGKKTARDAVLMKEKRIAHLEEQIAALRGDETSLQSVCAKLEEELSLGQRIQEKKGMSDVLFRIKQGEQRREQLTELSSFAYSEIDELDGLSHELESAKNRHYAGCERARELSERLVDKKNAITGLEQVGGRCNNASRIAAELLEGLARFDENLPKMNVRSLNIRLLIVAGVLFGFGVGLLVFFVLSDLTPNLALLLGGVIGIGSGILCAARAVQNEKKPDTDKINAYLMKICREAQKRMGPDSFTGADTLEELKEELSIIHKKADSLAGDLLNAKQEYQDIDKTFITQSKENENLNSNMRSLNDHIQAWLSSKGIRNRDEYIRKLQQYDSLSREQNTWEQEIQRELARTGIRYTCSSQLRMPSAVDMTEGGVIDGESCK